MAQLKPDHEKRHGLHVDRYWPGLVTSTWEIAKSAVLKRERVYEDALNETVTRECWQLHFQYRRTRFGLRYERDL